MLLILGQIQKKTATYEDEEEEDEAKSPRVLDVLAADKEYRTLGGPSPEASPRDRLWAIRNAHLENEKKLDYVRDFIDRTSITASKDLYRHGSIIEEGPTFDVYYKRLMEIYGEHAPKKIHKIDDLLLKHGKNKIFSFLTFDFCKKSLKRFCES